MLPLGRAIKKTCELTMSGNFNRWVMSSCSWIMRMGCMGVNAVSLRIYVALLLRAPLSHIHLDASILPSSIFTVFLCAGHVYW